LKILFTQVYKRTILLLEPYLLHLSNFKNRQLIAKFRASDHNLEIEKGRYKNIPPLYFNYNDCLIKVQISDERSGFGLRIYFNLFKSDIFTKLER
jgi:hypothetical protein